MKKHDTNSDGQISWDEFVDMMLSIKTVVPDGLTEELKEEIFSYSVTLNTTMKDHEHWSVGNQYDNIPIDEQNIASIFYQFKNGEYMCDLLHQIDPDCGINPKRINRGAQMNIF